MSKIIKVNNEMIIAEKTRNINRDLNFIQIELKFEQLYNTIFTENSKIKEATFFISVEKKESVEKWNILKDATNDKIIGTLFAEFKEIWETYKEAVKYDILTDDQKGYVERIVVAQDGQEYKEYIVNENEHRKDYINKIANAVTGTAVSSMCDHFFFIIYDRDTTKIDNLLIKLENV